MRADSDSAVDAKRQVRWKSNGRNGAKDREGTTGVSQGSLPVHVAMVTTEEYSEDAFFVGAVMESTTDVIERPDSENDGGTACKWQSC